MDSPLIQFTSGDFFKIVEKEWESINIPFSTFNVGSWNGKVAVIGQARQEEECENATQCAPVMLADNSVAVFDQVGANPGLCYLQKICHRHRKLGEQQHR